jgi:hypothetical protein
VNSYLLSPIVIFAFDDDWTHDFERRSKPKVRLPASNRQIASYCVAADSKDLAHTDFELLPLLKLVEIQV